MVDVPLWVRERPDRLPKVDAGPRPLVAVAPVDKAS